MKILIKKIILLIPFFALVVNSFAQEDVAPKVEIDASKPTNLYTQVNTNLEYKYRDNEKNIYGMRFKVQYAFNPDNLLFVEVPLLYNESNREFGLSDIRVRYFNVVKRNITKRFIAIAPFADVSVPTGNYNKGLGTSSWSLSAGVVFGYLITDKISIFPGVGYVYVTKPTGYEGKEMNGVNFQTNLSISFSKKVFLFINPIVTAFEKSTFWSTELNLNFILKPSKFKLNIGYIPEFTKNHQTFIVGGTFFL